MKKFMIIFASLIVLIGLFVTLRPQDTVELPIQRDRDNGSSVDTLPPEMYNIERFSDARKNISHDSGSRGTGVRTARPKPTPKPLPYPRVLINYSMRTTRSIGSNSLDKNSMFVIVTLDIRNYGYRYFDAHPNKFRIGKSGEIEPLINVSTGKIMDAIVPNNSRAKGDIVFLLDKKARQGKIKYSPANKSENYYIIYKQVSLSDIEQ